MKEVNDFSRDDSFPRLIVGLMVRIVRLLIEVRRKLRKPFKGGEASAYLRLERMFFTFLLIH
jgi:hypothetical protein